MRKNIAGLAAALSMSCSLIGCDRFGALSSPDLPKRVAGCSAPIVDGNTDPWPDYAARSEEAMLTQADFHAELSIATEGVAQLEQLATANPCNPLWQRELAAAALQVSIAYGNLENPAAVLASYRSGLDHARMAAALDPGNEVVQYQLVHSYRWLGTSLVDQRDNSGAIAVFRTRQSFVEKYALLHPDDASWQREAVLAYEDFGYRVDIPADERKAMLSKAITILDGLSAKGTLPENLRTWATDDRKARDDLPLPYVLAQKAEGAAPDS